MLSLKDRDCQDYPVSLLNEGVSEHNSTYTQAGQTSDPFKAKVAKFVGQMFIVFDGMGKYLVAVFQPEHFELPTRS